MNLRPFRNIKRRKTKKIKVGNVEVGGDAKISVLIQEDLTKKAVKVLHKTFELD